METGDVTKICAHSVFLHWIMSKPSLSKQKSATAPVDTTHVPSGIDSSTFLSPEIPEVVKCAVPLLHELPIESCDEIIIEVANYLVKYQVSNTLQLETQEFEGTNFSGSRGIIFSGLYSLLRAAIRQKVHFGNFAEDLRKMNFPEKVVERMVALLKEKRHEFEHCALDARIRFPRLEKLRWRIDVSISSGSLSRVMRPSILMQIQLSSGKISTFEVSVEQFNQLRYGTAKVNRSASYG